MRTPSLLHDRNVLRLGDELDLRHLTFAETPVDELHNRDVDHLEEFVLVKVLPYVGHLLALLHFLLRLLKLMA